MALGSAGCVAGIGTGTVIDPLADVTTLEQDGMEVSIHFRE
jgi:hypothetical protein